MQGICRARTGAWFCDFLRRMREQGASTRVALRFGNVAKGGGGAGKVRELF